ncbi:MAG: hypothetical protein IKG97_01500, partial [Lachnospiraceae bacterium]|nr:hypothetical protein [Lachnospiraceae bacterium]
MIERIKKNIFLSVGIGGAALAVLFTIIGNAADIKGLKDAGLIILILSIVSFIIAIVKATKKKADRNRMCKNCGVIPDWRDV